MASKDSTVGEDPRRLIGRAPRRTVVIGALPQPGLELSAAAAGGRDAAVSMIVNELTRLGAVPRPRLH